MRKIVWKTEYSIGHYQTDQEHRELIALANTVIGFSNTGEQIHKIKGALKALRDYTEFHFRNEERYMTRIGYPAIADHKQCHKDLIQRMNQVITQNTRIDDLVQQLKRLMVVWVIEHIIHEDKKIASPT